MQKAKGWALALITRGEALRGAPFSGMARHRLVAAFLRYSGAVYAVHPLLTLMALISQPSATAPSSTSLLYSTSGLVFL